MSDAAEASETVERVIGALRGCALRVRDEEAMQGEVAKLFAANDVTFVEQEVLGPGERIDFLCGQGVGVELKTRGGAAPLIRQLARYAAHERIRALVVVSTRRQLLALPSSIGGKPISKVWVGAI